MALRVIAYGRDLSEDKALLKTECLRGYARRGSLEIVGVEVDYYLKEFSSHTLGGIVAALDAIERGAADSILVLDRSDLTDPFGFAFSALEACSTRKLEPIVARELDSSTALEGRIIAFPESRPETTKIPVATRRKRATSGRGGYGPAPIGYAKTADKSLVASDDAYIVRRIFEAYLNEKSSSLGQLVDDLNSDPILGSRRRWSKAALAYLLKNPVYIGKVRVGEDVSPGTHMPLVSNSEFERTQRKLAENRTISSRPRASCAPPHGVL